MDSNFAKEIFGTNPAEASKIAEIEKELRRNFLNWSKGVEPTEEQWELLTCAFANNYGHHIYCGWCAECKCPAYVCGNQMPLEEMKKKYPAKPYFIDSEEVNGRYRNQTFSAWLKEIELNGVRTSKKGSRDATVVPGVLGRRYHKFLGRSRTAEALPIRGSLPRSAV